MGVELLRNPLFELGDLDRVVEEGLRTGALTEVKAMALREAFLETAARFVFNPETPHSTRLEYMRWVDQVIKEVRAARLPAAGVAGAGFAVQIILPNGAGAPGSITAVGTIPGQHQVETPQAPILDIPFDDLGLPATPDYVRAAAARITPERIA